MMLASGWAVLGVLACSGLLAGLHAWRPDRYTVAIRATVAWLITCSAIVAVAMAVHR